MKDCFSAIHDLLREKKYMQVLSMLFNRQISNIESPYDSDLNHAWYIVGDIFFKQGEYEQAVSSFKKALDDWPDDVDAMLALSNCYSELNMPKKSEEVLLKAKKISPMNMSIIYNLGNSFFDQKMYQQAINMYNIVESTDENLQSLATKNIKRAEEKLKNHK